jgi:hypothetical protein
MAGGSHANFDGGAFTAGAIGGSSLIAGALVAGVTNALQRRQPTLEEQLRTELHCEQLLRNWHYDKRLAAESRATAAEKRADAMEALAHRARADIKRLKAQMHLQSL